MKYQPPYKAEAPLAMTSVARVCAAACVNDSWKTKTKDGRSLVSRICIP